MGGLNARDRALAVIGGTMVNIARRHYQRRVPLNGALSRMSLEGETTDGILMLRCVYEVEFHSVGAPDTVVFLASQPGTEFTKATCTSGGFRASQTLRHGGVSVVFERPSGPRKAIFSLDVAWPARSRRGVSTTVLSVPDSLPSIVNIAPEALGGSNLPRIQVRIDNGSIEIGGIWSAAYQPNEMLEAILVRSGERVAPIIERGGVVISQGLRERLTDAEAHWVRSTCDQIKRYLQQLAGVATTATIVVRRAEEMPNAWVPRVGANVMADARHFGIHETPRESDYQPADLQLAARIAGIWWGGGCRLVGKNSGEWEAALCIFWAACWLEQLQSRSEALRQLEIYAHIMTRYSIESMTRRIVDKYRPWVVIERAAAIYTRACEERSIHQKLSDLLSEYWGRYLPVENITRLL